MTGAHALTRSGLRVDLAAPAKDAITARDIAEHLAKQPMYRGATWGFYSIAQHSVLVAGEVARAEGPLAALYALLHHAEEAFANTGRVESARFTAALHGAFDLDWPPPATTQAVLNFAHDCVTMSELRSLCTDCDAEVAAFEKKNARPLRGMIKPLAWDRAMDRFIDALRVNAVAASLPKLPVWGDIL